MGGILLGWFTATEAAVVAVVYGLHRRGFHLSEIHLHDIWNILRNTASITGSIAVLVGSASVLSYLLANEQIPQGIAEWIMGLSKDQGFSSSSQTFSSSSSVPFSKEHPRSFY